VLEWNRYGNRDYEPALFGEPNLNRPVRGQVYVAVPYDGCSPINFQETTRGDETIGGSPIFLVRRSTAQEVRDGAGCTFVTKVRNAQQAGAAAVVVKDFENFRMPFMKDDGTGRSITIPSILVKQTIGEAIKQKVDAHHDTNSQAVRMSLHWSVPSKTGDVRWDLWTDSADSQARPFKQSFGPVLSMLGVKSIFTPRYYVADGVRYGCHKPDGSEDDDCERDERCIHKGRYCKEDPDELSRGLKGRQILYEDLRQLCLFKILNETDYAAEPPVIDRRLRWFNYTVKYEEDCGKKEDWGAACSKRTQGNIGLSRKEQDDIQKCFEDSGASGNEDGQEDVENGLLKAQLEEIRDEGVFVMPSANVNRKPYYGALACPLPVDLQTCGLLEVVCASFNDTSDITACKTSPGCPLGQVRDECQVCDGNGESCFDCRGTRFGDWSKDLCGECKANDDPSRKEKGGCGGVPAWGIVMIVFVCVSVVGAGVYFYMKRQQTVLRDDIDNLLKQYLPLEGENADANDGLMSGMHSDD